MAFLIVSLALHAMNSNAVLIDPTSSDEYISVQLTDDPRGLNEINSDNEWEIKDQGSNPLYDWALRLDLDAEEYSFRSGVDGSSISITMELNRGTSESDAHFAFSIGDNSYFTFMMDLDNYYDINVGTEEDARTGIFIYPECGSTAIISGDVSTMMSSIPSSDYNYVTVREELCGGVQDNCYQLTSSQNGANSPISFELINNDLSDTFTFKFSSPSFSGNNVLQCTYDISVDTGKDFKLYISPDVGSKTMETIMIESFEIDGTSTGYTAQPTTVQPTTAQPTTAQPTTAQPTTAAPTTLEPTDNPTPEPTLDGCDFDIDAYLEQCYCTNDNYNEAQVGSLFYKYNENQHKYNNYDKMNKYNYNNEYYNGHDANNNFLLYLIFFLNVIILIILGFFICVYFGFCGKNNEQNRYEKVYVYSDPEDAVKNALNQ